MEFRTVHTKHNDNCPVCGNHPTVTGLVDYEQAVCDIESHRKNK